VTRVYAILDNLSSHRAADVLLWAVAHARGEFVFQPAYAADLNLNEPWWTVLRFLALKGRRFTTWAEGCRAVTVATGTPSLGGDPRAVHRVDWPASRTHHCPHERTGRTNEVGLNWNLECGLGADAEKAPVLPLPVDSFPRICGEILRTHRPLACGRELCAT
jgi:hypothetical protein